MRLFPAVVYMGLGGAAILAAVVLVTGRTGDAAPSATAALIAPHVSGDMGKLAVLDTPVAAPDAVFFAEDGTEMTLADYRGRVVVVNFWATWCAPCRVEMPTLSGLQEALGGPDFEVVTIATGRNDPVGMDQFLTEVGADNLPRHADPQQALARAMGVLGLPVTVVLDREGREIARLMGDADWNSDSARAIMAALIAG